MLTSNRWFTVRKRRVCMKPCRSGRIACAMVWVVRNSICNQRSDWTGLYRTSTSSGTSCGAGWSARYGSTFDKAGGRPGEILPGDSPPAEVRAVSALRPLPRGGLSHRHRLDATYARRAEQPPEGDDKSTRMLASAEMRGFLARRRSTTRCCGRLGAVEADNVRVCSPPSRRVAALRPRFAGLTALTAAPRTLVQTGLVRRRNKHDPLHVVVDDLFGMTRFSALVDNQNGNAITAAKRSPEPSRRRHA